MADRMEAIRGMLVKTPDDTFLRYSLAMEHAAAEQYDQAIAEFRRCVELDADYLAAYVEAGKCLRSAGRFDEARETFVAAMELAEAQADSHVRDYVQQLP